MKPLQGIQVVSLAVNLPGPMAAARMRDLGASVVKVEPLGGDPLALASPDWYTSLHEGVEVSSLDLKAAAGRARLDDLLATSDLLLTATRPAGLKRLGLDWAILSDRYPELCHVAIVGYLPPDEGKAGHDLTYQASLGLLDPPRLPRTVLADLAGAERAVSVSLALLLGRERDSATGRVSTADRRYACVALAEAAASFAEPLQHGLTVPGGLLGGGLPAYNLYQASEGWIAVAALEQHFLQRLAAELGLADVTYQTFSEAFRTRSADEWEAWAAERDLPIAAVRESQNAQVETTRAASTQHE